MTRREVFRRGAVRRLALDLLPVIGDVDAARKVILEHRSALRRVGYLPVCPAQLVRLAQDLAADVRSQGEGMLTWCKDVQSLAGRMHLVRGSGTQVYSGHVRELADWLTAHAAFLATEPPPLGIPKPKREFSPEVQARFDWERAIVEIPDAVSGWQIQVTRAEAIRKGFLEFLYETGQTGIAESADDWPPGYTAPAPHCFWLERLNPAMVRA